MSYLYIVKVYEGNEAYEYEYGNLKHATEHFKTDRAEKVELIEYTWDSSNNRHTYRLINSRNGD